MTVLSPLFAVHPHVLVHRLFASTRVVGRNRVEGRPLFPKTRGAVRERVCDMGYLRVAYRMPDGRLGYRCAAEPEEEYLGKGGRHEDSIERQCLCNGLTAAVGLAQLRKNGLVELPVVTSGDDLTGIAGFLAGRLRYSAAEVIDYLLATAPA